MTTYQRPYSYEAKTATGSDISNLHGLANEWKEDNQTHSKSKLSNGWRPPKPYTRNVKTGYLDCWDVVSNLTSKQYPKKYCKASGAIRLNEGRETLPPFPQSLVDRLIVKARLRIKDEGFNAPVCFAEREECGRMIGENAKRIAGMIKELRQLRHNPIKELAKFGKRSKNLRDLFLEYQYGWKPLMSDSFQMVKALEEREDSEKSRRTHVSVTGDEHDVIHRVLSDMGYGGLFFRRMSRCSDIEYRCKIRLDFTMADPAVATLSQLGLTNPLEVAWELVPFSFVADWFIPIGDYLSMLDATVGCSFKGGSCSMKTTMKTYADGLNLGDPSKTNGYTYPVGHKGYQMRFNRNVYSSFPLPHLPSFKPGKSGQHVANGIALIHAALGGRG